VIGLGGILTYEDALEFLILGASAVQIGTGLFVDPLCPVKILEGIESFLNEAAFDDISQIIGSFEWSVRLPVLHDGDGLGDADALQLSRNGLRVSSIDVDWSGDGDNGDGGAED